MSGLMVTARQFSAVEPGTPSDEWFEAVARRDRAFDGRFYYGVRTTGVYCRPSCASRAARRENLSFYLTAAAAELAGFRPCKRCHPDHGRHDEAQLDAVNRACRLIATAEEPPSLDALAEAAGLSSFHFHRVFKKATGVTPKAYVAAERARRVATALQTAGTVTEAIYDAGFNSSSRFYETSTARLGMTPTTLRRQGAGSVIRFAISRCSLGSILVATTEQGICSIMLGDDPAELARDLRHRFAQATIEDTDAAFEQVLAQVVNLIEAPDHPTELSLDIRGTAFQQRVWQELRSIPLGKTASYAEIAQAIGQPAATRAVAQACASNPLAVAIPCHRVVRSDGQLSGYRWGVERKRALLEREADRIASQGTE
jgi:AraC family transcriptional regulator of adaptative response/methylated-DNA-[protein]-cysteine methyltransferase